MPTRSPPRQPSPHLGNRLLAALPPGEFQALLPSLATMALRRHHILLDEGQPVEHVYFPHRGVVSLTVLMRDGQAAEATTIGPEGFVGVGTVLGRNRAYARNIVQVSGTASRMEAGRFHAALAAQPRFRQLVFLYIDAFIAQLLRLGVCNALHSIEERAARWLLMAHDRAGEDAFDLTQEFFAEMLGVRRASVNLVSRTLQQAGLIASSRGRIRILDRAGLEDVSCECYAAARQVLDENIP
jgi:CRP-like cAMP-binding protein